MEAGDRVEVVEDVVGRARNGGRGGGDGSTKYFPCDGNSVSRGGHIRQLMDGELREGDTATGHPASGSDLSRFLE